VPPGIYAEGLCDAGLTDISEETLSVDMVHESPERYWEFMTDVASAVVSSLAQTDSGTRDLIRTQVLDAARTHERTAQSGYRPLPRSWWERSSHASQIISNEGVSPKNPQEVRERPGLGGRK
jgi:hypothetical protein